VRSKICFQLDNAKAIIKSWFIIWRRLKQIYCTYDWHGCRNNIICLKIMWMLRVNLSQVNQIKFHQYCFVVLKFVILPILKSKAYIFQLPCHIQILIIYNIYMVPLKIYITPLIGIFFNECVIAKRIKIRLIVIA
jgi:hypothetical protein